MAWVLQLFSRFFGEIVFWYQNGVFHIFFYMVFPLEYKIEHAGSMLSYAIIDSCSTDVGHFLGSC